MQQARRRGIDTHGVGAAVHAVHQRGAQYSQPHALHAGQRQKQAGKPAVVETTAYEKNGRLFVQIANSCSFPVQFDAQGVPTTSQPGHGLGVRSICAIVEQYGGMYSFARQQDQFVLRISL